MWLTRLPGGCNIQTCLRHGYDNGCATSVRFGSSTRNRSGLSICGIVLVGGFLTLNRVTARDGAFGLVREAYRVSNPV